MLCSPDTVAVQGPVGSDEAAQGARNSQGHKHLFGVQEIKNHISMLEMLIYYQEDQ